MKHTQNKLYYLPLALLVFCSCSFYDNNENTEELITTQNAEMNYSLLGQWNCCKVVIDELESNYNVCPIFFFNPKGSGSVSYSNKKSVDSFKWNQKNNHVYIEFTSEKSSIFKTGTFQVIWLNNNKEIKLQMTDSKGSFLLYLRRE
jgi:hypothetical protein